MINQLILIAAYALFLLLQSLFINGIKISSAGDTEILPNGKEQDSEMILYWLYKWLCQSYFLQIFYVGNEAYKLQEKINSFNTGRSQVELESYENKGIFHITVGDIESLQKTLDCIGSGITAVLSKQISGAEYVEIYKPIEVFKYNKYIRKPIIQCIICMASFWGFFTYWIPIYFIFGISITTVILWIANTVILSYVNYLVYKKL